MFELSNLSGIKNLRCNCGLFITVPQGTKSVWWTAKLLKKTCMSTTSLLGVESSDLTGAWQKHYFEIRLLCYYSQLSAFLAKKLSNTHKYWTLLLQEWVIFQHWWNYNSRTDIPSTWGLERSRNNHRWFLKKYQNWLR